MTPKEKAEELISSYRFALSIPNAPLGEHKDSIAKQCALVAVDEIIKATTPLTSTYFWQEVKEEIEKL
jgi:hypothetical protein